LRNAYFGDLHLHTSYSMDAFAFGTRTTPEDSYRYAMGEPVEYFGKQWKRLAPLDFLAVTDHAEYLGTVRESINPNGPFAKSEWYTAMTSSDPKVSGQAFQKLLGSTMANKPDSRVQQSRLAGGCLGELRSHSRPVLHAG